MREFAHNRQISNEGSTALQRTLSELHRLRQERRSKRGGNSADIDSRIRLLEKQAEEIVSHR